MRMNAWIISTGILILGGFTIPVEVLEPVRHGSKAWSFAMTDPMLHIGALGLFAVVAGLSWRENAGRMGRAALHLKVALFSALYGLFVEIYQAVLPWRFFGFDDLLFNGIGVVAGLVVLTVFFRYGECVHIRKAARVVVNSEKGRRI